MTDYWNHNSAYHSWILKRAAAHRGDSLDVGCGEGSLLHRETRNIGVPVAEPQQSLSEISATARAVLPHVSIRRALYYRYLLRCRKPAR
jgi:hypothetical protein